MDRVVLDSASGVQPVHDGFASCAGWIARLSARSSWLARRSRGLVYAVAAQKPRRRGGGSVAEFARRGDRAAGLDANAGRDCGSGCGRTEARCHLAIAAQRPAPDTIGCDQ